MTHNPTHLSLLLLLLVMVGLPARGKTYIARKLCRYLSWLGLRTQVFNVGNYRRKQFGAAQPHNFFDSANLEAREQRTRAAVDALEDMKKWFDESSCSDRKKEIDQVAIYDATNTTKDRRNMIKTFCDNAGIQVLFIESICDDEELILANIKEVKLSSPDYRDSNDGIQAVQDFRQRIQHYADVYQQLDTTDPLETNYPFVKLINVRARIVINRVSNYLESRIVFYLVNLHIKPRSIYIVRHGESQHNVEGKIGGDALLSSAGEQFAAALPALLAGHLGGPDTPLTVWTSTLRRTIQTASNLPFPRRSFKSLDELDAGVCDGLTYEQISAQYPEDYAARDADKYNYRYRGGESYADLVHRIEPVIMELERVENVLIISHQAIIRVILAYFLDKRAEDMPYIQVPLHTLIKLTPKAYDCGFEVYPLKDIPAVDTFRPKPSQS